MALIKTALKQFMEKITIILCVLGGVMQWSNLLALKATLRHIVQNYIILCNQTTIKDITDGEEASILTHLILWDPRIRGQGPLIIEDQIESMSAAVMFLKRPSLPVMTRYMYCSPRALPVQICKNRRKTSKLHHLIHFEQITDLLKINQWFYSLVLKKTICELSRRTLFFGMIPETNTLN